MLFPLLTLRALAQHAVPATALSSLPVQTTLPVSLGRTLRADKAGGGMTVSARTTQRIPLSATTYLPSGTELLGTTLRSSSSPGETLELHFAQLRYKGQTLLITVRCIAIASFINVSDTRLPASQATDRGNSDPANWTTRQVGGDEVVRSGWSGDVINQVSRTVGFADYNGVYALPRTSGELPRALGVFSTTAGGLYGSNADCSLDSTSAAIAIRCTSSKPVLHAGDNLLLELTASPSLTR